MPSEFAGKITADGEFPAESGRYHLYASYVCPYAQRAINARAVMGLQDAITMDIVDALKDDNKWVFNPRFEGSTADTVNGKTTLEEVYKLSDPDYEGKISVPVLWDKQTSKVVNNDSAEVAEMLCTQMGEFATTKWDFYPEDPKLEETFSWINANIIGQLFKPFGASDDEAKHAECKTLYEALEKVEEMLGKSRYLHGDSVTKADMFLFAASIRVDPAYSLFYISDWTIKDSFPNLWAYLRDLYQNTPLGSTHFPEQIYAGCQQSGFLNPSQSSPEKLDIDYMEAVNRESLKSDEKESPSTEPTKDATDGPAKKEDKPKSSGCNIL